MLKLRCIAHHVDEQHAPDAAVWTDPDVTGPIMSYKQKNLSRVRHLAFTGNFQAADSFFLRNAFQTGTEVMPVWTKIAVLLVLILLNIHTGLSAFTLCDLFTGFVTWRTGAKRSSVSSFLVKCSFTQLFFLHTETSLMEMCFLQLKLPLTIQLYPQTMVELKLTKFLK